MTKKGDEGDLRVKAADDAIQQIREKFGDGAIMRLGEAKAMNVEAISTGSVSLDIALGVERYRQNSRLTNLERTLSVGKRYPVAPLGAVAGLDSAYLAQWRGPHIGLREEFFRRRNDAANDLARIRENAALYAR